LVVLYVGRVAPEKTSGSPSRHTAPCSVLITQ
jgi:hypothetical protein